MNCWLPVGQTTLLFILLIKLLLPALVNPTTPTTIYSLLFFSSNFFAYLKSRVINFSRDSSTSLLSDILACISIQVWLSFLKYLTHSVVFGTKSVLLRTKIIFLLFSLTTSSMSLHLPLIGSLASITCMITSERSTTFLTSLHYPFLEIYATLMSWAPSGSIIYSAS